MRRPGTYAQGPGDVRCPECGAAPDELCDGVADYHSERYEAASGGDHDGMCDCPTCEARHAEDAEGAIYDTREEEDEARGAYDDRE